MKVLIIGANSYIGARLFFDISKKIDTIGTYSSHKLSEQFVHLNIQDTNEIHERISSVKPTIVLHCANNANAKWCESHPEEAKRINQEATASIVEEANAIQASVIYISSFSAMDTQTVYGQTKAASEAIVKNTHTGYCILRPALTLGMSPNTANDRPFNRILKNIDGVTKAEYDTSWKFQPTYIYHLSQIILQTIEQHIWNKTHSVAVTELKSRYDVANDILSPFSVPVLSIDKQDTTPVLTNDLKSLSDTHMPTYSYAEMISCIHEEIKKRKEFIL